MVRAIFCGGGGEARFDQKQKYSSRYGSDSAISTGAISSRFAVSDT